MGPNRRHGLTARQLQCLRGKWDRKMDKEIAHELGISQRAVEEHLRGAREKLDVASTRAAVLMVAAQEGWEGGSVDPYRGPSDLPIMAYSGAVPFPEGEEPARASGSVRDSWPQSAERLSPTGSGTLWPLPIREGQRNDLSTIQRLAWPFAIAMFVMAILFLGFGVANGAGRFVGMILHRLF
jgi:DNA-binding CsgD family transcriptional regulator